MDEFTNKRSIMFILQTNSMNMKNLIPILFIISLFGVACNHTKNDAATSNTVIVCGKITNPTSKKITFAYSDGFNIIKDSAILDSTGSFRFVKQIAHECLYKFKHGKEFSNIYLRGGDSLYFTLNTDSFDESLIYQGKGAEMNNFLANEIRLWEMESAKEDAFNELSKDSFVIAENGLRAETEKRLSDFYEANKANVSEAFLKIEKQVILLNWACSYGTYPSFHYYATDEKADLGDDYDNYINELDLNDTSLIGLDELEAFLQTYLMRYENDLNTNDPDLAANPAKMTEKLFNRALEVFKDKQLKNYALSVLLKDKISQSGTAGLESVMQTYSNECSSALYKKVITDEYNKWKTIEKGAVAPLFSYQDINGKQVSLSDFKGKYVYIDVWASWCGPCKREIPYMKTLEEEFKNKNIVFMQVSLDDNKTDWETMVKEKQLGGIQLWAGGWASTISKDYIINSIPRFILIDKEGKIIDSNAPRPSGEISKVLSRLDKIAS